MPNVDPLDLVLQLHNIARQLEQVKHLAILGRDLRQLADQVNRVHARNREQNEFYAKLDPLQRDYLDYLAHLGE